MIRRLALLLLIAAPSAGIAAEPPPPPPAASIERLDAAAMDALVADEMQLVNHGFRDEAEQALEARIEASNDKLAAADLIEAYGVELSTVAEASGDRAAMEASRLYLRRAVAAYQEVLGSDDPQVATALVNYADAERALQPEDPPASARAAYDQAYRIRKALFGASAPITLRTRVKIAELEAVPARTSDQPAATRTTARKPASVAKPVEIREPGSDAPCTLETADGGMIFEGEPNGLAALRERAEASHVHLQPCGRLLALQIPPRSNVAAMAALINAVAAGQFEGVRMRLLAGNR